MKMKKVLPILMAAVLTTASLPMMANASDASSDREQHRVIRKHGGQQ